MNPADRPRILVVRNDKLGDFMLAWPALAALKRSVPDAEVHVLVSAYTAEMARLCPDVDEVVIDADIPPRALRDYDVAITLISTTRIGWRLFAARIPLRIAPATKIAQVFYNRRLVQRRSRSEKPEHAYNTDLVRHYLESIGVECREGSPPWLKFPPDEIAELERAFRTAHGIGGEYRLVFVHPGSGGSARNLSLEQYARLARALRSDSGHHVIISAGPGEEGQARALSGLLSGVAHGIYQSTEGLERFARHLAFCDLFIGGSTGPLHIAGTLNRNTAAFYTRRRSATALRWQTINEASRRLAFSPPDGAEPEDMSTIDLEPAAAEISRRFLGAG